MAKKIDMTDLKMESLDKVQAKQNWIQFIKLGFLNVEKWGPCYVAGIIQAIALSIFFYRVVVNTIWVYIHQENVCILLTSLFKLV